MLRTKSISTVLLALLSAGFVQGMLQQGAEESPPQQKTFMRRKLAATQKIVEGLATDNFKLIDAAADELLAIRESAQWTVSDDPFYSYYSRDFEARVRELKHAAASESPEKATFAYVHVAMSCTACHQRVRRVKRTAR